MAYGAIEEPAPRAATGAAPLSGRRRGRWLFLSVASAAVVAAAGLVVLAATAGSRGGVVAPTALNVYGDKYRDVREGGNWMDCLKCRHDSGHCHPTKSEAEGRRRAVANACPPHAGMTTVLMKRNGQVEVKWIDEAVLQCAQKKMRERLQPPAAEEDPAGDEEGGDEGEEGGDGGEEEATPFCVRPSTGERAKWEASEDCTSVAAWLGEMGVYGDDAPAEDEDGDEEEGGGQEPAEDGESEDGDGEEAQEENEEGGAEEGGGQEPAEDGASEEEEAEEWDPEGKTPLEVWGHNQAAEIYETYYGGGEDAGGGDEAGEDEGGDGEGDGDENEDGGEEEAAEGDPNDPCFRVVQVCVRVFM